MKFRKVQYKAAGAGSNNISSRSNTQKPVLMWGAWWAVLNSIEDTMYSISFKYPSS